MGYIYKISNSINDKLYIGKTCTTLSNRWSHHISDYTKYDWHLYRAMRKYGIENFSIELVEECEDNKLNEQEQYWINYYNSYNNGYNMTIGGDGRIQIDRSLVIEYWKQGQSIKDISNLLGCWPSSIIQILKEQQLYDKDEVQQRKIKNIAASQSKRIIQYDDKGNIIQYYNSPFHAAIANNTTADNIRGAITTGGSRLGYFWGREGEKLPNFHTIIRPKIRSVAQYDLNNNLLNIFNSAAEAARSIGYSSGSSILKVCKGQRHTAGNYIWRYYDEK